MQNLGRYKCIVLGVSAGGMDALSRIFSQIPGNFSTPIAIVQHIHADSDNGFYIQYLQDRCKLRVQEACEKTPLENGVIFIAPPNYHLLLEKDLRFSLSVDAKVNYARPSIDVLFESAADALGPDLIGIILTGANRDGAHGLFKVKEAGGLTIVQEPKTAEVEIMPNAAIEACNVDFIQPLEEIAKNIISLCTPLSG